MGLRDMTTGKVWKIRGLDDALGSHSFGAIVFDRIRENFSLRRRESYDRMINISINASLSRTIITSLTTLAVVLFLLFMGGEVIHDFAFALMVGIVVGTYSSIYVASPILIEWQNRMAARKRAK
jgi:preprotein translocase subunit SecF